MMLRLSVGGPIVRGLYERVFERNERRVILTLIIIVGKFMAFLEFYDFFIFLCAFSLQFCTYAAVLAIS